MCKGIKKSKKKGKTGIKFSFFYFILFDPGPIFVLVKKTHACTYEQVRVVAPSPEPPCHPFDCRAVPFSHSVAVQCHILILLSTLLQSTPSQPLKIKPYSSRYIVHGLKLGHGQYHRPCQCVYWGRTESFSISVKSYTNNLYSKLVRFSIFGHLRLFFFCIYYPVLVLLWWCALRQPRFTCTRNLTKPAVHMKPNVHVMHDSQWSGEYGVLSLVHHPITPIFFPSLYSSHSFWLLHHYIAGPILWYCCGFRWSERELPSIAKLLGHNKWLLYYILVYFAISIGIFYSIELRK